MIENLNTIFFDLDGTLIDTRELILNAAWDSIERYAPGSCSYETVVEKFGIPYPILFNQLKADRLDEMKYNFHQLKTANYDELVKPFAYLKEGLQLLRDLKLKLGIVTNQNKELTQYGLERFEIIDFFDTVVTGGEVHEPKPSPDILIEAMRRIGTVPNRSLMVGDSEFDILAANRADIDCVLLESYGTIKLPPEAVPTYIYANFLQFVKHFTKN
jgi:pyrophosphatase PpaX